MELQNALDQIAQIKRQMARTRTFRGYRAGTTALTGLLGLIAAAWQMHSFSRPSDDPIVFVSLWVGLAVISIFLIGTEIGLRYWRTESPLDRELTVLAVEQFLPAIVVGALVTLVMIGPALTAVWMLPGLWAILFGMGMFASRRVLPAGIQFAGMFYVAGGLVELAMGPNGFSRASLQMGIVFGLGQMISGTILYFSLERNYAAK